MKPLGRIENPVRGFLHGCGALVSLIGTVALVARSGSGVLLVYGSSLVGMYSTSTLYHAVPWRPRWKSLMQRFDHSFIYVLVAATFTALAAGVLSGPWMWSAVALIWGLAALGVLREFSGPFRRRWSLVVQVGVGAIALGPVLRLFLAMDPTVRLLTVGGGIVYLVGVAMFVRNWPRLYPAVFSHHELFHVLVIVASVAHFVAVWQLWIPPL